MLMSKFMHHKWHQKICLLVILLLCTGCTQKTVNKFFEKESVTENQTQTQTVTGSEKNQPAQDQVENIGEKDQTTQTQAVEPVTVPIEKIGELKVDHIIMTPEQEAYSGMRLTFELNQTFDKVEVYIIDQKDVVMYSYQANEAFVSDLSNNWDLKRYKAECHQLLPDTDYAYVIVADGMYSDKYSFTTISKDQDTTLLFLGDAQGYAQKHYDRLEEIYLEAIKTSNSLSPVDVTYLAGDLVDSGDDLDQWSYLYKAMEPYFSTSLFLASIGNHDVRGDGVLYTHTFNFPKNGIDGLEERNFYIDLANVRIAVWDSESPDTFEQQGRWLQNVMEQSSDKFHVVLIHRSAYPMAYDEAYIRALAPYFENAGINLVLSGHDHIYNRTTMKNDQKTTVSEGVTYVVGGSSSGSKYYEAIDVESRYWKEIMYDNDAPVYTLLRFEKNQILVNAYAVIDDQSQNIDSFVITK